jgi:MarR family transcriptional regulator for hemolysin
MRPSPGPPIGLHLARATKAVSRAFEEALATAGGSSSTWLILISLKSQRFANQRELAEALGIEGPTLTHHLNAMETDGLITRERDPDNRRIHRVELTEHGEAAFIRMRGAATAFDERLRKGLTDDEIEGFRGLLDRLHQNVRIQAGGAAQRK